MRDQLAAACLHAQRRRRRGHRASAWLREREREATGGWGAEQIRIRQIGREGCAACGMNLDSKSGSSAAKIFGIWSHGTTHAAGVLLV